jgi:hypothetical protein
MKWEYNGVEYNDKHDDSLYGFIYCVYYEDEDGNLFKYYGKHKWIKEIKKHFGKRRLAEITDKRLKTYEIVTSDSEWRDYVGSCKDTMGYIPIHKEIICFACSQRELTWLETKILIMKGALEDDMCLNGNILGKFFKHNLV